MKTVADFKRNMKVGTHWETTHQYTDRSEVQPVKSFGSRVCGKVNTVGFAFNNPKTGNLSYRNWPSKKEFSVVSGVVVINTGFCILTYKFLLPKED